jgi:hypothetical protein
MNSSVWFVLGVIGLVLIVLWVTGNLGSAPFN